MHFRSIIVISATLAFGVATASAQDSGRYQLEKTNEGYVRMDTETGQMSICEERSGQLVCKLAADDRDALQDQIEALQDDVAAIDKRLSALEGETPATNDGLPTEEEFEKSMSYMERFFRRFMDIVKDFDGAPEKSTPQEGTPERT
ncbi:hypothetical protein [Mesorhizobium xinjiangense]|uniref:hypothetical protein n=1 Tax=Mesorhizobium xinjiangense TaxID=2678685 RepID=UPI0012ED0FCC|nr:hypothetical protein [Mesorhizobium xinjiangense]